MLQRVGLLDGEHWHRFQNGDEDLLPGPGQVLEVLGLRERKSLESKDYKIRQLQSVVNKMLKNGPSPASLSFIFVISNKQYNFFQQINVENVHPIYGAGIRTHNLWNMNLLP